MLYPVYVHKDPESAYGVTFPDFPGCFSAADELEELPRLAQEAVEVHFEGEDEEIPSPTAIEELAAGQAYEDGFWLLIDLDLTKVNTKSVRLNISLPANLVGEIDRYAAEHHMTRSGFLAKAAHEAMGNRT
ncbi:MAG TPA: type II toxin-antitoxin system HicB family antitoxin [Thermoanaerobaculia bacterium]|nr:type II toxin-antitoxin system HicB family antitoxin [Thermoanaerobaculia bacterium]